MYGEGRPHVEHSSGRTRELQSAGVIKKAALLFVGLSAPAILLTFLFESSFSGWVFALLGTALPLVLIVLGASRDGRLGPLLVPLLAVFVLIEGSVVAMLALRGQVLTTPWVGGLPLATAIMLYVAFLAPLPLVALAYALTFDRFALREEDLQRLRDRKF